MSPEAEQLMDNFEGAAEYYRELDNARDALAAYIATLEQELERWKNRSVADGQRIAELEWALGVDLLATMPIANEVKG